MTSRHLYFKLLKEDMKRKLWAAALLGLALFFSLPVALAMVFPESSSDETITLAQAMARRINQAISILDFGDGYPVILMILFVAALVLGVSTFSYLHNKKQIDFYHSLPVRREMWFLVHISTGLLIPAVVYLIAVLLALVVCMVNGVFPVTLLAATARGYFGNMLYYMLVYATVVLAMMMTGTRLAAVLGTAVFFLYCPMTSALVTGFYEVFFDTYYYGTPSIWREAVMKISPMYTIISAFTEGLTIKGVLGIVGAALVIGILEFFLYLKRPSEAAGKTMAFGWSKGIIKVLLVVVFGMAGGMFFYTIRDTLPWMVFGNIVGVVISHCVIEVIYHSDFKKLFHHEKTMAACMTAALAISLSFYFDLFHYDTYVPEEGAVAYASIDFGEDSWVSYDIVNKPYFSVVTGGNRILDKEQLESAGAVIGIAREGIRQLDAEDLHKEYNQWCDVTVCYTLKNGRRVYRNYSMYLDPVMDLADQVYLDPEYKKALYPGLAIDPEEAAGHVAYLDEMDRVEMLAGNRAQWKAVVEAYQQEMTELTMSRREIESPMGELLLMTDELDSLLEEVNQERDLRRYERMWWYEGFFYPIYPSFTKTISALEDCGIVVGEAYRPENLGAVQITAYGPFGEDGEESGDAKEERAFTITYTDPEQIEEILQNFSLRSRRDKNDMVLCSQYRVYAIPKEMYTLEVTESAEDRGYYDSGNWQGHIIYGKVPDFVIEDFQAEWEKWKKEGQTENNTLYPDL